MDRLLEIINKFPEEKVGVIGDLMLDRYLICEVERISPEAPVPVAKVLDESYVLGGAANVAANVRSLGGEAEVFGLVGADQKGDMMLKLFRDKGIGCGLSFSASNRPTTVKSRLMAGGQQIVRVDREKNDDITHEEEERLLKRLPSFLEKINILVLSDYAKGLLTENIAKESIRLAKEKRIKVLSDPVPETFYKFRDSYLIKPNKKEAEAIAGIKFKSDYSNIGDVFSTLHSKLSANLVVTLGKDGMAASDGAGVSRVPTVAKEVFDVSGAGDTVMAALALSLAAEGDFKASALIGNYCAGVVVGKIGTATVSRQELMGSIKKNGVIDYAKVSQGD